MLRVIYSIAILCTAFAASLIIYSYWNAGGHPIFPHQHVSKESIQTDWKEPESLWSYLFSKKPKDVQEETKKRDDFFIPKRLSLRYVQGAGSEIEGVQKSVAYGTDYGTIAALFSPKYHEGKILPFLDIRAEGFINNTYACNVGVGGRYIPSFESFCAIIGMNAYYDFRGGFNGPFHQIGIGMEVLGKRWDFRANGYIPLGAVDSHRYKTLPFAFNCELGYLLANSKNFLLYSAIGPYFFSKKDFKQSAGGEIRLRPQYKDFIALDLSIRYDSVFHAVFQAEMIFYWPLYQVASRKNQIPPCGLSERQIYQPIERFEVMPLHRS